MDFELTNEQRTIQETFGRFADEQIVPRAAAIDEAHEFPHELFGKLGELGFFGMRYPEEAGGSGFGLLEICLAMAEIARGSVSLAGCATIQSAHGNSHPRPARHRPS